jgi:hypothetical protein
MSTITPREEFFKKIVIIDMGQERLCQLNRFGWSIVKYMYTPYKIPEKETWVCLWNFFENYHRMFKSY